MYRCFKLSLDLGEFILNSLQFIEECRECGFSLREELLKEFKSILNEAIDQNGIIDGELFIDNWFPTGNYDVFLSYSHDDKELAMLFAGFLKHRFGLKVFIDELFWGSADELLKLLDDEYCKNERGNYDYSKRNFTTAHIHAMLSTAIAKTIYNSEVVIFLNSEKSTYRIQQAIDEERTRSPWIYEEILFTSVIAKREWYEHRTEPLSEGVHFQKSLQISYLLPNEHLISMQYEDLCHWYNLWQERKENGTGRYGDLMLAPNERIRHPLNVLYDFKCGCVDMKKKNSSNYGIFV